MTRGRIWTVLTIVVGFPQIACAMVEEQAADISEQKALWQKEGSLGFNRSSGNSSTQNLLGKVRLFRTGGIWDLDMKAEAIVSTDGERKTRETVIADFQSGINFADRGYSFANFRHTDDKFGPFTRQTSLSAGIGWRAFKSDRNALQLEGGLGVRQSEQRVVQDSTSETVLRGKLNWQYQLTETASLLKNVRVESGPENTLLESETSMRLKINTDLGLKLSYRLRANSQVPAGARDTDTLTAVSLDFLF